jgi:hypothetical protein
VNGFEAQIQRGDLTGSNRPEATLERGAHRSGDSTFSP